MGIAVTLSADGTYLAVGSNPTAGNPRRVSILTKRGSSYKLEAQFTLPSTSFAPSIGSSVSFSADGTVLAMGGGRFPSAPVNSDGIYVAVRAPDNRWTLQFSKLNAVATNGGYAIQCSADGAFIVAGEPDSIGNQGRAFIFRSTGSFIPNDTVVTGSLCVYKRTTIDATLKVAGNIHLNNVIVTGTGRVTPCAAVLSDKYTKDNITKLDPAQALAKLRALQPVTFVWKDTHDKNTRQIGFIAQHMQGIFPHWVGTAPTTERDTALLNDNKKYMITIKAELYAYLIAALEKLVQRNAEQKAAIAQLQPCFAEAS